MNSKRIHSMAGTRQRQAAILLEVLVSLGLLTFGLSVVGMRIRYALDSARLMNTWSRGILLADAKMAELQAGAVKFKTTDDELKGYFGVRYPGYSWRIRIKPTQTTDLFFVTLHIGFNGRVVESQRDNPEQEIDIDQEGTKIIRTLYRLEPKPADLNLSRDFGIPVDELMNGAAGAETGGGGASGDAAGGAAAAAQGAMGEFMQMVLEFLTAHPELLNETGGIDLQAMSELPAEDFQTAMQLMQQFLQTGQNFEALQQQFEQSLNGERQGGRRGGRRGGGRDGQGGQGGRDGQGSPDGGGNVDGGGRPEGGRGGERPPGGEGGQGGDRRGGGRRGNNAEGDGGTGPGAGERPGGDRRGGNRGNGDANPDGERGGGPNDGANDGGGRRGGRGEDNANDGGGRRGGQGNDGANDGGGRRGGQGNEGANDGGGRRGGQGNDGANDGGGRRGGQGNDVANDGGNRDESENGNRDGGRRGGGRPGGRAPSR